MNKMLCSKCGQMIDAEDRVKKLEIANKVLIEVKETLKDRVKELEIIEEREQKTNIGLCNDISDLQVTLRDTQQRLDTSSEKLKEAVEIIRFEEYNLKCNCDACTETIREFLSSIDKLNTKEVK